MTGRSRVGLGLIVFLVAFGGALAAEDVTLNGTFVWEREDGSESGGVKAIFTPTGKSEWDVAFHFDWKDEPHIYLGTASGSLSKGEMKGAAESDGDGHTMNFRFNGSFKDGAFTGTHAFVDKDGETKPSGTLTLAP